MSIDDAVQEFLLAQEADGSSPKTLGWYKHLLMAFASNGGIKDSRIRQIAPGDIRRYLIALKQRDLSDATVSAHTRALHKFWAWATQEYGIVNPMRNIKYPKVKQPQPRAAELDDLQKMFQVAKTRDRAIIAFMLDTGCRAAGVCNLRMTDVDMRDRRAMVTEKGNKTRAVVFTAFTQSLIEAWIAECQPANVLFYSDTLEALTASGLYQMLRRLARRSGVTGRFNPHSLRHTFAREYIRAGGDLATLAKLMGHRDVSTTVAHYTIFTDREVRDAHEKYSPVGRLKGDDRDTELE